MHQQYQCSNCGAPVAFGMRFCGRCGVQLNWPTQQQPPPSYQQQTQRPAHNNWFKCHLNWTYFIGILIVVLVAYGVMAILGVMGAIIGFAILLGCTFGLACWILNQKGRNLGWAVLSVWIWFIPLILSNNKEGTS
jgi:hypothetical protein